MFLWFAQLIEAKSLQNLLQYLQPLLGSSGMHSREWMSSLLDKARVVRDEDVTRALKTPGRYFVVSIDGGTLDVCLPSESASVLVPVFCAAAVIICKKLCVSVRFRVAEMSKVSSCSTW